MNLSIRQWLHARRSGIGGSDAAAIMGLSKWKTPFQVYQDKIGEGGPDIDSEPMLWGRQLEPVIRQQYAERTGRTVYFSDANEIIRHPKHEWMLASLDGKTEDGRVLEIKTARTASDWGEAGTDQIPQQYLIQVQHYMAVTGLPVADVAVLIGGSDFRLYEVPADAELQAMMIEAEHEFWQQVIARNPPEPVSFADAVARYKTGCAGEVVASESAITAIQSLKAVREQIKALEADEDAMKAVIMNALGESDTLTSGGKVIATWKNSKPATRFDVASFKEAHPDLYAKFCTEGVSTRRFLIK